MNKLKKEILEIVDLDPFWFSLNKNPIPDIVKTAKSHQLITLLERIYGFKRINPVLGEVRYFHYKESIVIKINSDIVSFFEKKIDKKSLTEDIVFETLQLLAKIIYFRVYNKKFIELLFQKIIKLDMIGFTSFMKTKALFIYYLYILGFRNIYIDKYLKQIADYQLIDGGWPEDSKINKESDIFTTLHIHRAFVANPIWRDKKFLTKSNKFLIDVHMQKTSSKDIIDRWSRLNVGYKSNNLFEGGTLILLESLINMNENNNRKIKSIINWIKSIQLNDGYFPYHANLKTQKNIDTTIYVLYLLKLCHLKTI